MVGVEFVAGGVAFGVKQIDIVVINKVFNLPDLSIDHDIQLVLIPLIIGEVIFFFPDMDNATLSIPELGKDFQVLLAFNEGLANRDVMGMRRAGDIPEV